MCRKIAFFWVRAEILLSRDKVSLDSRAGPFLGFVNRYGFLEKYTPLPISGQGLIKKSQSVKSISLTESQRVASIFLTESQRVVTPLSVTHSLKSDIYTDPDPSDW